MSEISVERRAHRRVEADFQLQGSPEQGGVVARMVANNLSMGGLCCVSTADFPEMTRLAVRLMLPRRGTQEVEPVELEAVVVRREESAPAASGDPRYELSLFFTRLEDGVRERIAAYIGD